MSRLTFWPFTSGCTARGRRSDFCNVSSSAAGVLQSGVFGFHSTVTGFLDNSTCYRTVTFTGSGIDAGNNPWSENYVWQFDTQAGGWYATTSEVTGNVAPFGAVTMVVVSNTEVTVTWVYTPEPGPTPIVTGFITMTLSVAESTGNPLYSSPPSMPATLEEFVTQLGYDPTEGGGATAYWIWTPTGYQMGSWSLVSGSGPAADANNFFVDYQDVTCGLNAAFQADIVALCGPPSVNGDTPVGENSPCPTMDTNGVCSNVLCTGAPVFTNTDGSEVYFVENCYAPATWYNAGSIFLACPGGFCGIEAPVQSDGTNYPTSNCYLGTISTKSLMNNLTSITADYNTTVGVYNTIACNVGAPDMCGGQFETQCTTYCPAICP
jgi:hypothetical protein